MMRKLFYLFLLQITICITQTQKSIKTASCKDMILYANLNFKVFSSPSYPGKFAEQTQCNWIIRAPNRYRVELTFDVFYLLGATAGKAGTNVCVNQYLRILDSLSGMQDGPYCGNSQPPTAISTGSALRVTLESNAKGVGQRFYKGFKASYRASRQASSRRFRDLNGKWLSYSVIGGDQIVTTTTTTTVATIPTRNPNEVDDNDNAAIDAINNMANSQNVNNNDEVNKRNNHHNEPPVPYLNPPPTRRRPTPPVVIRKIITTIAPRRRTRPPRVAATPRERYVPLSPGKTRIEVIEFETQEKENSLSAGGIVGIVFAILIFLVVVGAVFYFVTVSRGTRPSCWLFQPGAFKELKSPYPSVKATSHHQQQKSTNDSSIQYIKNDTFPEMKTPEVNQTNSKENSKSHPKPSNQHRRITRDSYSSAKETDKNHSKRGDHQKRKARRDRSVSSGEKTRHREEKRSHRSTNKRKNLPVVVAETARNGTSYYLESRPRKSHRHRSKHRERRKHHSTRK